MSVIIDPLSPSQWRISNGVMCVHIDTLAGGNITAIEDSSRGIQWLWRNPHRSSMSSAARVAPVNYGRELDVGGWDDIWLSVAPAEIDSPERRIRVPDHGDLVGRAVDTNIDQNYRGERGQMALTTQLDGVAARYQFTRSLVMAPDNASLRIDYSVTADEPLPWFWSAHPLFAIVPSLQIDTAGNSVAVAQSDGDVTGSFPQGRVESSTVGGAKFHWPLLDNITLDSFSADAKGIAAKVFIPATGEVILRRLGDQHSASSKEATGSFIMRWDKKQLPWLGLWVNDGGWSGLPVPHYRNLGIEPTNCPYDSVASAEMAGELTWLKAGESRRWSITIAFAD